MPLSAAQNAPLGYPVPSMADQHAQAGYSGPAPVLPQPVSRDVFSVGLDGPAGYTASYVPVQSVQAGPSHLRPTQMFPQPQPQGVDFRPAMQAPMPPPQQHDFINLGDDIPQRQIDRKSTRLNSSHRP